MKKIKIFR